MIFHWIKILSRLPSARILCIPKLISSLVPGRFLKAYTPCTSLSSQGTSIVTIIFRLSNVILIRKEGIPETRKHTSTTPLSSQTPCITYFVPLRLNTRLSDKFLIPFCPCSQLPFFPFNPGLCLSFLPLLPISQLLFLSSMFLLLSHSACLTFHFIRCITT